jgi:hypothetical protein
MVPVCVTVIGLAFQFRRTQLTAANYQHWRILLLGWRALHGVAGGVVCALLYGSLDCESQRPLLITVVVFTYGLTFFAIEDLGLAMVGTAPIVLCLLVALPIRTSAADQYIAVLLVAASINGWLAGSAISRRLFEAEAARTRQRNAVLVDELAKEVDDVTRAKAQAGMLRNLLENAVRCTPHGEVRLRARRKGEVIVCQVWDTGVGTSRADQRKVFDDYFQVQNTARRAQDGLGLSVVRRLVALTGTRIALHSRLGKGSCFGIAIAIGQPGAIVTPPMALLSTDDFLPADHDCVLVL